MSQINKISLAIDWKVVFFISKHAKQVIIVKVIKSKNSICKRKIQISM